MCFPFCCLVFVLREYKWCISLTPLYSAWCSPPFCIKGGAPVFESALPFTSYLDFSVPSFPHMYDLGMKAQCLRRSLLYGNQLLVKYNSSHCFFLFQWSLVFDTENWETSFRNMPKQMDSQLFEAIVDMESTNFSIQLPMYHTMPVSTIQIFGYFYLWTNTQVWVRASYIVFTEVMFYVFKHKSDWSLSHDSL